jgi:hypothetical protein
VEAVEAADGLIELVRWDEALVQGCLHDRVDPNAVWRQLDRERLG